MNPVEWLLYGAALSIIRRSNFAHAVPFVLVRAAGAVMLHAQIQTLEVGGRFVT